LRQINPARSDRPLAPAVHAHPQAAVGAASREQAGVLFDIVRELASHPSVAKRVEVTRREIRTANGWLRVVASDGPKQHGLILSLAIVDELHAHRDGELYTALRTGMMKRDDARMVTISTAGSHAETPLGELRARALAQPRVEREGMFTRAVGQNIALLEWSLPEKESIDDLTAVKAANPASFVTLKDLAEQRDAVHEMAFRRYHANQWVAAADTAITPGEWGACARPGVEIPAGHPGVTIGLDIGLKWDTTALVPVARVEPDEPLVIHTPVVLVPPRDGSALQVEEIVAACEQMAERWLEPTFVVDPEQAGELVAQQLEARLPKARIMTHSQAPSAMARASELFAELVGSGGVVHPGDATLTQHVTSAAAKFMGERWRFVKQRRGGQPIDAVIAACMATRVLLADETVPADRPGLTAATGEAVVF